MLTGTPQSIPYPFVVLGIPRPVAPLSRVEIRSLGPFRTIRGHPLMTLHSRTQRARIFASSLDVICGYDRALLRQNSAAQVSTLQRARTSADCLYHSDSDHVQSDRKAVNGREYAASISSSGRISLLRRLEELIGAKYLRGVRQSALLYWRLAGPRGQPILPLRLRVNTEMPVPCRFCRTL